MVVVFRVSPIPSVNDFGVCLWFPLVLSVVQLSMASGDPWLWVGLVMTMSSFASEIIKTWSICYCYHSSRCHSTASSAAVLCLQVGFISSVPHHLATGMSPTLIVHHNLAAWHVSQYPANSIHFLSFATWGEDINF
eukprot:Gb_13258 [translate_table: standard]